MVVLSARPARSLVAWRALGSAFVGDRLRVGPKLGRLLRPAAPALRPAQTHSPRTPAQPRVERKTRSNTFPDKWHPATRYLDNSQFSMEFLEIFLLPVSFNSTSVPQVFLVLIPFSILK